MLNRFQCWLHVPLLLMVPRRFHLLWAACVLRWQHILRSNYRLFPLWASGRRTDWKAIDFLGEDSRRWVQQKHKFIDCAYITYWMTGIWAGWSHGISLRSVCLTKNMYRIKAEGKRVSRDKQMRYELQHVSHWSPSWRGRNESKFEHCECIERMKNEKMFSIQPHLPIKSTIQWDRKCV